MRLISRIGAPIPTTTFLRAAFLGNETDKLALLGFKSQITEDPARVFASWNDSVHFCQWTGVKCGLRHGRVIRLNLKGRGWQKMPSITKLRLLGLSVNSLSGEFPPPLYNLSSLELISLSFNNFSGNLRSGLGNYFPNLQILYLAKCQFIGSIPSSLANKRNSKLLELDFPVNNFT
ncbi:hypothetical protein KY284_017036 [Solanum tuberosum]|nr:hypothetical protein KY284_017036 [Solanum tuberosum]